MEIRVWSTEERTCAHVRREWSWTTKTFTPMVRGSGTNPTAVLVREQLVAIATKHIFYSL